MQLQQATEHCMVLEGERASMFHTNNWKWELCTTSIQASRRNSIEIQIWHFHRHHSCAHHVSLAGKIQQMLSCCCWRWQGKWIKFATRSNRQRDCVHSLDCKRILSLLNHSWNPCETLIGFDGAELMQLANKMLSIFSPSSLALLCNCWD